MSFSLLQKKVKIKISDSDEKSTNLNDETKSGSSVVMSPVTPPTPDDEDKTLIMDVPEPETTQVNCFS